MIAISWDDYLKYGCVNCGYGSSHSGPISGGDCGTATCRECRTTFCVLFNGAKESSIGFGTGEKDSEGKQFFEYPKLQQHPRKGIPWHPWVQPDPRPEEGEYWNSRGIGYDLSGFVKSKAAGERLLEMVKKVLGKDDPDSWLDYREYEPEWIQFKFKKEEFDLEKLDKLSKENNRILTEAILIACKR